MSVTFLAAHPYLLGNLAWLAALLTYCRRTTWPAHARGAVLAGLGCLPCAPLALMHEGTYWSPHRWSPWRLGLEDGIFTFVAAATAWLAATYPWRRDMPARPGAGAVRRGMFILSVGAVLTLALEAYGLGGLLNTLAAAVLLWAALVIVHPAYLRLAAVGAAGFVPLYLLIVRVQFWCWPAYIRQWNVANPLAAPLFGIPVGELLWAVVFACAWPAAVATAFGWTPPARRHKRALK